MSKKLKSKEKANKKSEIRKDKSFKLKHFQVILALTLLSFIFYGNSLKNQYSLDDNYVIVDKPIVERGIVAIPKIFKSYYADSNLERHSYRPVTTASFAIEHQFFGANPFVSHFINILLYAFCCFLVFKLVLYLKLGESALPIALISAFIFLVLPVHSEVVNNVKSRDELLTFSIGFLAVFQFLKYNISPKIKHLVFGILLLLLSLLAKLTTLTLIALIPFILVYFRKVKISKQVLLLPLLLFPFIALRVIKRLLVKGVPTNRIYEPFENPLFSGNHSFMDRIPIAISTVGDYLKLIFYPDELIAYYGHNQVELLGWGDAGVWLTLLVILGSFGLIYYFWNKDKLISFGFIWFYVAISMFTNLVKPVVGIIAERFAFLPSAGIAIALGALIYKLTKSTFYKNKEGIKWGFLLLSLIIVGVSWNKVVHRNKDWYDKFTLYESDVKKAPKSAKLQNLYANMLFRKIRANPSDPKKKMYIENAIHHYNACLEISPNYANAWNNLGVLVLNEYNDPKRALGYLENAIKHKEDYTTAIFGAGYAWEVMGNNSKAIEYYQRVSAIDPNFQNVQTRITELNNLNK